MFLEVLAYVAFRFHAVSPKAYLALFERPADRFGFGLICHACYLRSQFLDFSILDI